jgi:lysine 2,3-aminomutase
MNTTDIQLIRNHMQGETCTAASLEKWHDWKWQMRHAVRDISMVEKIFDRTFAPEIRARIEKTLGKFPMSITPYYLSLVDPDDLDNDPVFKQAFPDERELLIAPHDMADPLAEDRDSPVPGLTHRYPDRVLLHVSNTCAMYCRHCTRKRKVGDRDSIPDRDQISQGIEYIRQNTNIRDVLLSGGDPFMLSDEYIDWILAEVTAIEHVEVVRIGTRTPVVLPYRINEELVAVLEKYENLWINTHFNHPREITGSARKALRKLWKAGIPLGNQSVLLADINDCPRIMKRLVQMLVKNRVRPYYIYQCDLSEGLEHFRTSIGKGIEIMESLRGHTSGFAVPTYVVDAPGGGGKIPVAPNYLISWSTNKAILRNFEGVITTYQEPDTYKHNFCNLDCDNCNLQLKLDNSDETQAVGIERLLSDYDEMITLTPSYLEEEQAQ